jgi:FkbM family methyltransferase
MQSPRDLLVYGRMRAQRTLQSDRTHTLRVRSLGGAPIRCRSSTADVFTFKAVFLHEFHLPPRPLGPEPVILDLGSNIGLTVAHLAHTFPEATVIGVEMDPANFALARENTARYGDRVRLLRAAVWTEDGVISYGGDRSDGFQVSGAARDGADRNHTAPAVRVDTLLDRHGISTADYVKMDVEGAEAAILAAAPAWLDRRPAGVVLPTSRFPRGFCALWAAPRILATVARARPWQSGDLPPAPDSGTDRGRFPGERHGVER